MEISICCYGAGNPKSISNMIKKIGRKSKLCTIPDECSNSKIIIIPGVGSFDYASKKIYSGGWDLKFKEHLGKGGYILGICLGMQILCESSEEGNQKGLGFIPGKFEKFNSDKNDIKVPHMGWNDVNYTEELFNELSNPRYYFVHSYYYNYKNNDYVIGNTFYGSYFPSIIASRDRRILGVQFHPEKSHKYGFDFFRNYFNRVL